MQFIRRTPAFFTPGICHLKSKNKFAAHPFGADYVNGLIVGQNNFFCDGKTQPCALFILAPGGICFIEPVKDLPLAFSGDTGAGILDGDKYFPVTVCGGNGYGRILTAEFYCVINQIIKYLLYFAYVRGDDEFSGGGGQVKCNSLL